MNYVAEVVPNFWGTNIEVFDYGFEQSLYNRIPKSINKLRRKTVKIFYLYYVE
jgi:hypothetical protein